MSHVHHVYAWFDGLEQAIAAYDELRSQAPRSGDALSVMPHVELGACLCPTTGATDDVSDPTIPKVMVAAETEDRTFAEMCRTVFRAHCGRRVVTCPPDSDSAQAA